MRRRRRRRSYMQLGTSQITFGHFKGKALPLTACTNITVRDKLGIVRICDKASCFGNCLTREDLEEETQRQKRNVCR